MTIALPKFAHRRRITSPPGEALYRYERALTRSGFRQVCGIDEAGRGACAGPLVVAAVVLDVSSRRTLTALGELNDSKQLTAAARERVYDQVTRVAREWTIVVISSFDIDRLGVHVANLQGMRRALARLNTSGDYALTDGFPVPGLPVPSLGVWKGDEVCASVAAAGVLAKVTRDRLMTSVHTRWDNYGFDQHKGYVTDLHRHALRSYGPTPIHRYSFAPVREAALKFRISTDTEMPDRVIEPRVEEYAS